MDQIAIVQPEIMQQMRENSLKRQAEKQKLPQTIQNKKLLRDKCSHVKSGFLIKNHCFNLLNYTAGA